MRPISEISHDVAAGIKVVFCDIDDTITTNRRLGAAAFQALEDLFLAGIAVVPVTGRPAGWCDMIARFWPVHGVVGENGAFFYAYDAIGQKMNRRLNTGLDRHIGNQQRFDTILDRVAREVPGAAVSADQPFRIADLAIDFCEDVPALPAKDINHIKTIFEQEGAVAKISSIHVNGWFGSYDKLSMSRRFAAEVLSLDIDAQNSQVVFVGDSPNDAPMFGFFDNSCGVANIRDFENDLDTLPTWVARRSGGAGFCEIVDVLLKSRKKGN